MTSARVGEGAAPRITTRKPDDGRQVDVGMRPPPAAPGREGVTFDRSTKFGGDITNAKGRGVTFKVGAHASSVMNQTTANGTTSFRLATELSVHAGASGKAGGAGVSASVGQGVRGSFEVRMPEAAAQGVDLQKLNPMDPKSFPAGTQVRMDGAQFSSTAFGAAFSAFAAQTKTTQAASVSVHMAKLDGDKVRVSVGPTNALKTTTQAGLDVGVASALAGRTDELAQSEVKTAEFDLSKPDARAAFNAMMTTGDLPAKNGSGVTNVSTVSRLDSSSTQHADLSLGPFQVGLKGQSNEASSVLTRKADGAATLDQQLRYRDNVPLHVTAQFAKDGKEKPGTRRYEFSLTPDANTARTLNMALSGGKPGSDTTGPARAGVPITLSMTEKDLAALQQRTQAAAAKGGPLSNLIPTDPSGRPHPVTPHDFALTLARAQGNAPVGFAQRLFAISGVPTGTGAALPMTAR